VAALSGSRRQLVGQATLADARLAPHQDEATAAGCRLSERLQQLAKLTVAPDEERA
jgi:hypothetical protein